MDMHNNTTNYMGSSVYSVLILGGWNRGVPLYTVSSFQGVGIEEFHCIQSVLISGGWNRGVPLYTECPHFRVLE